ncbi:MAG TPA: TlpA disulfide reductase family protein [Candidatus Polarisedimenticolia bacterium]|nr:TlpA disulfide reductase family protein [Candidatus Polarisedimenticolia bacterium]
MKTRRLRLPLALLLLGALAVPAAERREKPPRIGEMAPPFTLPDLEGRSVSLEGYRGREVVQIVGWATWCHGCREELPRLLSAYEKLHRKGFEILAITGPVGQDLEDVKAFAREKSIPYPILYDESRSVLQRYGMFYVPYNCLLDRSGRVVYEGGDLPEDYEKRIEQLLARNGTS